MRKGASQVSQTGRLPQPGTKRPTSSGYGRPRPGPSAAGGATSTAKKSIAAQAKCKESITRFQLPPETPQKPPPKKSVVEAKTQKVVKKKDEFPTMSTFVREEKPKRKYNLNFIYFRR